MTPPVSADSDHVPGRVRSDRGHGQDDPIPRMLAQLVEAIGGPGFPTSLLEVLSILADVELCSVFARENGQRVELIFAHGDLPARPGFALQASQAYMRNHWRSDRQLAQFSPAPAGIPVVIRRRASDIADPAYRTACYDTAGVIDRVSILSPGRPCFVINGYRTAGRESFAAADVARIERYAAVLLAALRQHLRITLAAECPADHAMLVGMMVALDCGLSKREAEVVAGLMTGETHQRIAAATGLSVSTIVTYRLRAYDKLGVANRRDLAALRQKLLRRSSDPMLVSH